jgi:hypothetical protein
LCCRSARSHRRRPVHVPARAVNGCQAG